MPVRYGGVTYPNLRYAGVNYPQVRYGGVTYQVGAGMVEVPLTPANTTVTVNLLGFLEIGAGVDHSISWANEVSLGSTFAANGMDQTLDDVRLHISNPVDGDGLVEISILGVDNNFKAPFVTSGRIIITASDGETLEVMIADADQVEVYSWVPANSAEVVAFANHVLGLTDKTPP